MERALWVSAERRKRMSARGQMNEGAAKVDTVIPGVYGSAPEPLPFVPTLDIRAFLLAREQGNLLIYNVGNLPAEARSIEGLGGISRHYLGHRHEAQVGRERTGDTFHAPLFCHENERPSVSETCNVAETFSERHMLGDDFEVIPIPGHTSGSTAYLWDTGQHRCLFTADSIYLRNGEWVAALLDGSSDREAYIASLELLRELDFDLLLPWAARRGGPLHAMTDRVDARRRVDAIIDRLRRGEDH